MNALVRTRARGRTAGAAVPGAGVVSFEAARIGRALAARTRYRYVQPRIEREGEGWKIVSPNCSRVVDPAGGDIDIAWFEPQPAGTWVLHARDHARGAWRAQAEGLTLADALRRVCSDPIGVFWP